MSKYWLSYITVRQNEDDHSVTKWVQSKVVSIHPLKWFEKHVIRMNEKSKTESSALLNWKKLDVVDLENLKYFNDKDFTNTAFWEEYVIVGRIK